jgi:hypothetical protein
MWCLTEMMKSYRSNSQNAIGQPTFGAHHAMPFWKHKDWPVPLIASYLPRQVASI